MKLAERYPIRGTIGLLIEDPQGRLLMVQQSKPEKEYKWGVPAGGIEASEDPIIAALREGREELGTEVEPFAIQRIYTVDRPETTTGMAFIFWARYIPLSQLAPPVSEILDARYLSAKNISRIIEGDGLYKPEYNRQTILDWQSNRKFYPLDLIAPLISIRI